MIRRMLKQEDGSVALEAAIVLPFFLAFFLGLYCFLTVAQTKIALRDAVDETVKTTAAHTYPADLIVHAYRDFPIVKDAEAAIDRLLPYDVKMLIGWSKERKIEGLPLETVFQGEKAKILEAWIKPIVLSHADRTASGKSKLREDRLSVRSVTLPSFTEEDGAYFGLTVEYILPLHIPFFEGEIILTESAYERCWVGNK